MQDIVLWSVIAATLLLMLWRPREIAEAWWVTGGAVALIALRLLPLRDAAHAVAKGTDVYLFLTGMMLLSELAREHGVFDWFAAHAVAGAHGSRARLFTLIYLVGIAITALMSNDATAVVMTPAVLAAAKKSGAGKDGEALPYLFACAMIANAASFLLPIANPANLVVFPGSALPPVGTWLVKFLLPSIASIAVTYGVLRWWFREELAGELTSGDEERPLSSTGRLVLWGIALMSAVLLTTSALKHDLGAPACVTALVLVVVVSWRSGHANRRVMARLREPFTNVSWSVLPLVAALFCLVEAANLHGLLAHATALLVGVSQWPAWQSTFATGLALGIGNNLVNNLPLGLVAGAAVQSAHLHGPLANAVLLGIDLGPNLSATGSLATILWLIRIRQAGMDVSAWSFLKVGALAMPLALIAALGASLFVER